MFEPQYCSFSLNNICIFAVILFFLFSTVNAQTEGTAEATAEATAETTTVEEEDSDEVTDLPDSVLQAALYENHGQYTTMVFHYHNHQYDGYRGYEYCYNHYTRCLTSLVVPIPVCAYDYKQYSYTFENYCDVHFENCLNWHRRLRILAYGKCKSDYTFTIDTLRRFLGLFNNADHVEK